MNITNSKVVPFVVIFQGRCGSTYFMEALNSHSQIHCWMEYFSTLRQRKASARDQLVWLDEFYTSPPVPCSSIGFKTKLSDVMDINGFATVLEKSHARIIHLQRRNVIKMTVSFFNSVRLREATGDWNLYDPKQKLPPARIDPVTFDQWLNGIKEKNRNEVEFIKQLQLPVLTLQYEDLLIDAEAVFNRVMGFLDVDPEPIRGMAVKSTSDDLRDSITNFNELRSCYAGTPYEYMFDEGAANA